MIDGCANVRPRQKWLKSVQWLPIELEYLAFGNLLFFLVEVQA